MGFSNLELYSDEFSLIRPGAKCLENVVAVLATPPNTNTAVKDPIELVVAKVKGENCVSLVKVGAVVVTLQPSIRKFTYQVYY